MKNLFVLLSLLASVDAFAVSGQFRRSFVMKEYSPNPSGSTAYSANDAFAGYSTLNGVSQDDSGYATLWGLTVTDSEAKLPDTDIMFFKAVPTEVAADNAAFTISGSSLRDDHVGTIRVANSNCVAGGAGQSVCTIKDVNLPLKASTASKLYVLSVVRSGQSTGYSSATAVKVKFFFGQE